MGVRIQVIADNGQVTFDWVDSTDTMMHVFETLDSLVREDVEEMGRTITISRVDDEEATP